MLKLLQHELSSRLICLTSAVSNELESDWSIANAAHRDVCWLALLHALAPVVCRTLKLVEGQCSSFRLTPPASHVERGSRFGRLVTTKDKILQCVMHTSKAGIDMVGTVQVDHTCHSTKFC